MTPVVFAPLAGLIGAVDTGVSAFGIPVDLGTRPLISADNVFRNEVVETLDGGALQIEFVDGTIFQLGENARMILNELVFDPVTGEGGLLVNLVEGVFRIISGAIPSENFTVVTPAATIGIRGTDFEVAVDEFGVTAVSVFEGEVEVEPNDDQPGVGPGAAPGVRRAAAIARAGERVALHRSGGDVVRGEAKRSEDRGLRILDEIERERVTRNQSDRAQAGRTPADRENPERRNLARGEAVRDDAPGRGERNVVVRIKEPPRGENADRILIGRRAELGLAIDRPDRQADVGGGERPGGGRNFGGEDRVDRGGNFGGADRPDRPDEFGGGERPDRGFGGEERPGREDDADGNPPPERENNAGANDRPEQEFGGGERPDRGNGADGERPDRENDAGANNRPDRDFGGGESPDRENDADRERPGRGNDADRERPDRENDAGVNGRPDGPGRRDDDAPVDPDADEENRRNNRGNDR